MGVDSVVVEGLLVMRLLRVVCALLIFGSVIAEDSGSGCNLSTHCGGDCSDPKSDHCGGSCARPTDAIDSQCVLKKDFLRKVQASVQFNDSATEPEWNVVHSGNGN